MQWYKYLPYIIYSWGLPSMCGLWAFLADNGREDYRVEHSFDRLKHRGPDKTCLYDAGRGVMIGFHRLAIVDTSDRGMGPFQYQNLICVCNGEIYNWEKIEQGLAEHHNDQFSSQCDCEVVAPLFDCLTGNIPAMCKFMNGEFAFIIYDVKTDTLYFATDELSTRPLFVGKGPTGWFLSSELIGLSEVCDSAIRVPSGHYGKITPDRQLVGPAKWYEFLQKPISILRSTAIEILRELILKNVRTKLHTGERLDGFFLSGGVDSSIICAAAAKYSETPIRTFTVGFSEDSPDVRAARIVAQHIGSNHHEYIVNYTEAIERLPDIIKCLGSYCQTTIRASSPMFMLLDKIKKDYEEMSVMYTGELADELFGSYRYFKNAPSADAHREESIRLLRNVHLYDGLRCDRVCSHFSIEARYPFFSAELLKFVLSIPPELIDPSHNDGIEKKILREAFNDWLPRDVLWRAKEAFSDATSVKSDWKEQLKEYASEQIVNARFQRRDAIYPDNTPKTPEDMLYRDIFSSHYSKFANTIPGNWMPKWCGDVVDSSATVLDIPEHNAISVDDLDGKEEA